MSVHSHYVYYLFQRAIWCVLLFTFRLISFYFVIVLSRKKKEKIISTNINIYQQYNRYFFFYISFVRSIWFEGLELYTYTCSMCPCLCVLIHSICVCRYFSSNTARLVLCALHFSYPNLSFARFVRYALVCASVFCSQNDPHKCEFYFTFYFPHIWKLTGTVVQIENYM